LYCRYKGTDLQGLKYEPLFNYFKHRGDTGAFTVLTDKYVTDASGTGIVHQAPYFGEVHYVLLLYINVTKFFLTTWLFRGFY